MKTKTYICVALMAAATLTSCEKVSPIGVLVSGTGVEDRVKMSELYYRDYLSELDVAATDDDYSFLVGADSHVTDDTGRMDEMFDIAIEHGDDFVAHLGDIADTKPEYYINLSESLERAKRKYMKKEYTYDVSTDTYTDEDGNIVDYDDEKFPFFPVVGNHDITHNGWALWSNIFHSSFYEFNVYLNSEQSVCDHYIFLDSASGTLGKHQIDLIEQGILDVGENVKVRHTFVFTHTNIFRPSSVQFASTFPREEQYFLLNQFKEWNATIVFCGHVHKWDDREVGGVRYLTLESMSERNSPEPGEYLVRVNVKKNGEIGVEKVMMNYKKP
ncbi:MAG: metallophosphoesterase [Prevotella sp.]|nr:metallophosphoesterase [Prevotella sp.]